MNAVIYLNVPDWQIGQGVTVYFPDTMVKKGKCEPIDRPETVRCKDCKYRSKEMYNYYDNPNNKVYVCQIHDIASKPDWFCADGVKKDDK